MAYTCNGVGLCHCQALCARHPTGVPGIDEGEETVADCGEETRRDHAIGNRGVLAPGRRRRSGPGHMIGIPSSLGLTTPFPFLSKGDSV